MTLEERYAALCKRLGDQRGRTLYAQWRFYVRKQVARDAPQLSARDAMCALRNDSGRAFSDHMACFFARLYELELPGAAFAHRPDAWIDELQRQRPDLFRALAVQAGVNRWVIARLDGEIQGAPPRPAPRPPSPARKAVQPRLLGTDGEAR